MPSIVATVAFGLASFAVPFQLASLPLDWASSPFGLGWYGVSPGGAPRNATHASEEEGALTAATATESPGDALPVEEEGAACDAPGESAGAGPGGRTVEGTIRSTPPRPRARETLN